MRGETPCPAQFWPGSGRQRRTSAPAEDPPPPGRSGRRSGRPSGGFLEAGCAAPAKIPCRRVARPAPAAGHCTGTRCWFLAQRGLGGSRNNPLAGFDLGGSGPATDGRDRRGPGSGSFRGIRLGIARQPRPPRPGVPRPRIRQAMRGRRCRAGPEFRCWDCRCGDDRQWRRRHVRATRVALPRRLRGALFLRRSG